MNYIINSIPELLNSFKQIYSLSSYFGKTKIGIMYFQHDRIVDEVVAGVLSRLQRCAPPERVHSGRPFGAENRCCFIYSLWHSVFSPCSLRLKQVAGLNGKS